jgi:hypothetical protein
MSIDEIIAEHEQAIRHLKELKNNMLTATDGALSLKEVVAALSQEKQSNIQLMIECAAGHQPEVEWSIWRGSSWESSKAIKGATLADAYRKFAHPDAEATVETVAKELQ